MKSSNVWFFMRQFFFKIVFAIFFTGHVCFGSLSSSALQQTSLISEKLNHAIQAPEFGSSKKTALSGEEIVNKVRPILRNRLATINYDRISPIFQFLDHYEICKKANSSIRPIEAYKSFKFDPLLPHLTGGPCVTLTLDIYNHLPQDVEPFVIAAKLPGKFQQFGFPEFSHTAVLISFKNPLDQEDEGYVLLDPSFDISEPILLREKGVPFLYDMKEKGIWKFYLEGNTIVCDILSEQGKTRNSNNPDFWRMTYLIKPLLNPIESSAMPMILADRRLSLLSRREDGSQIVHLNIELNKERVIWDQQGKLFDPIPFNSFTKEGWNFPNWFSQSLFVDESELLQRILRVINNKDVLDSLYVDYLGLLKETRDFSVTGALDIGELEKTLEKFCVIPKQPEESGI